MPHRMDTVFSVIILLLMQFLTFNPKSSLIIKCDRDSQEKECAVGFRSIAQENTRQIRGEEAEDEDKSDAEE